MIKSRKLQCAEHVSRLEETRNSYRILVGKPHGKWYEKKLREDIKIHLEKISYGDGR
jgi:hypothetical protein